MKVTVVSVLLAMAVMAKPQLPTPSSAPPPLSSLSLTPIPVPIPVPTVISSPMPMPAPTGSSGSSNGAICECGYTYCASVLMAMKKPWNEKQLADAYCATPNASCQNGSPPTNITSALYICLCNDSKAKVGSHLELICGCDTCLNIEPDYRGRCATPCYARSGGKSW